MSEQDRKAREPLVGYVVIDEHSEDMSHWDGAIAFPNPEGATLFWENPAPFIEKRAYDDLARENKLIRDQYSKLVSDAHISNLKYADERDEAIKMARELRDALDKAPHDFLCALIGGYGYCSCLNGRALASFDAKFGKEKKDGT